MALVKEDLAKEMMSAMAGCGEREAALNKLAHAIQEYVKGNAQFMFAWAAANPAGVADPVLMARGGFLGLTVAFNLFKAAAPLDAQTAFALMGQDLVKSFSMATYNITDQGFGTSPGVLSSSPSIAALKLTSSGEDKREGAFNHMAAEIVDWLTTQVPATPCTGTHGAFTGAGSVTKVL
jgi:hypothetical protein